MKKTFESIIFGKSTRVNGLIALFVISLIVFGCTCNGKKFDFGKKGDTNSSRDKDVDATPDATPEKKEITRSDASKGKLPADDELEDIIKTTLLEWDKAVKDEDFTDFYDNSSKPFQKSITPAGLKTKFQEFIDGNADISSIEKLEPKYSEDPKISRQGRVKVLEAKGEFNTRNNPTRFDLKYIPEGKEWKLISFAVYTTVFKKR